jgi:2-polyprenyl-3-methyl-5-hydroxy-6-metoxy-1,4-benzoquinol methylase
MEKPWEKAWGAAEVKKKRNQGGTILDVLDVGCGNGGFPCYCRDKVHGLR